MTTITLLDPLELSAKREHLEDVLTRQDDQVKDLELQVFDIITQVTQGYQKKLAERNKDIITKIHNATKKGKSIEHVLLQGNALLINSIKEYGHGPAFIFGLNIADVHGGHFYRGNTDTYPVGIDLCTEEAETAMQKLAYQDNATIISPKGIIMGTHVHLSNLNPAAVIDDDAHHPEYQLVQKFQAHAHARHNSARAAAYAIPGSVFYTLSEETGHVYRFGGTKPEYRNRILFSTHDITEQQPL